MRKGEHGKAVLKKGVRLVPYHMGHLRHNIGGCEHHSLGVSRGPRSVHQGHGFIRVYVPDPAVNLFFHVLFHAGLHRLFKRKNHVIFTGSLSVEYHYFGELRHFVFYGKKVLYLKLT